MIQHPAFPVDPWALRETELDLERLAQTESVFALANGHVGLPPKQPPGREPTRRVSAKRLGGIERRAA